MDIKVKEYVRKDFGFLQKEVLGVLVYGSHARGDSTPRSDIDVCVVIGRPSTVKGMGEVLRKVWRNVNLDKHKYDVKLFEELPLKIKKSVIEEGKIVVGERLEIYEYFYRFRKLFRSQKQRQG